MPSADLVPFIIFVAVIGLTLLLAPLFLFLFGRRLRAETPEKAVRYLQQHAMSKYREEPLETYARRQVYLLKMARGLRRVVLGIDITLTVLFIISVVITLHHPPDSIRTGLSGRDCALL
jgi:ABC-type bacteriocin/lantibiotic exporter with double-glycine peptidase domain